MNRKDLGGDSSSLIVDLQWNLSGGAEKREEGLTRHFSGRGLRSYQLSGLARSFE